MLPIPFSVKTLAPSEQIYLSSLMNFTDGDWQNWVDRVCSNLPRRPLTPIADVGMFPILSYTFNLLENYSPFLKIRLLDAVFQKFNQTPATEGNTALLSELLDVLQIIRPYAYKNRIETLLSNPYGAYRFLWYGSASLHIQLIRLYSTLHDNKQDDQPDPFAIYLYTQPGNHPAPGQFIEVSLLHFQDRSPETYFAFAHRLVNHYTTSDLVGSWLRAFQTLLRERLQYAHQLFRWFKDVRKKYEANANTIPDYEQWNSELRLQLSRWIERRKFYKNNPFIVLLYSELIAGLKPPLAYILSLHCDLDPTPRYELFELEHKANTIRLLYLSFEKFGIYSREKSLSEFSSRKSTHEKNIELFIRAEPPIVRTHYDFSKYASLFAPGYITETDIEHSIRNLKRLQEIRVIALDLINMLDSKTEGDYWPDPIQEIEEELAIEESKLFEPTF